jgi:hypothetical protein
MKKTAKPKAERRVNGGDAAQLDMVAQTCCESYTDQMGRATLNKFPNRNRKFNIGSICCGKRALQCLLPGKHWQKSDELKEKYKYELTNNVFFYINMKIVIIVHFEWRTTE